ncbi:MAG: TlyA family RNA methyltransferase [Selenomonadaceae bacterium]|nr:TlyA family RNA methyltransferase [Selenomonadaceae bacterium]
MAKERLDVLLVKRGLAETREKAKTTLMAGLVLVNGQKIDKAGTMVKEDAELRLLGNALPYVSRGGLKLEKAMEVFGISLDGKVAADIGASTGGFTDCALQRGAAKVFAIDVGYGQLAWKLRSDPRVVNMERTNIRYVRPEDVGELIDFASIDVAFISLTKVLEPVKALLGAKGEVVALVKPQFEAGRENVGKKGVVRDPEAHKTVIREVAAYSREIGFFPAGLTFSPIKGPEGNIEYLLHLLQTGDGAENVTDSRIAEVVAEAHEKLNGKGKEER